MRLRPTVKDVALAGLRILPERYRRRLFRVRATHKDVALAGLRILPERFRRRLFRALAIQLNVSTLEIRGRNGTMTGEVQDYVFNQYIRDGVWSPEICETVRRLFGAASGGTFIDIGAHIGLVLVPVAQNPSVACLGFEADPRNFALLQRNVERNCEAGRVELFNVALFDRNGSVDFELSPENFGDHRVRNRNAAPSDVFREDERRVISVDAKRLDSLVDATKLHEPLVVKIDTQGAEQHIYAGGQAVLARATVLILEFWVYGLERMGGEPEDLIRALEADYGYGCFLQAGRVPSNADLLPIKSIAARMRQIAEARDISSHNINRTHDILLAKTRSLP